MTSEWLVRTLLLLGVLLLVAALAFHVSLWPGVVLAGLSLLPWAWEVWNGQGRASSEEEQLALERRVDALVTLANEARKIAVDAHLRAEEHQQQINSLRNAASLRGTLGG